MADMTGSITDTYNLNGGGTCTYTLDYSITKNASAETASVTMQLRQYYDLTGMSGGTVIVDTRSDTYVVWYYTTSSSSENVNQSVSNQASGDIYLYPGDKATYYWNSHTFTIPYRTNGTLTINIGFKNLWANTWKYGGWISLPDISNSKIKVNGSWKDSLCFLKINDVWRRCLLWKKVNGTWKKGNRK